MLKPTLRPFRPNSKKIVGAVVAMLVVGWISMPALAKNLWQQPDTPDALGAISGLVLNEAGQPLPGIEVTLIGVNEEFYFERLYIYTETDSEGRYRANGLTTGLYRLRFNDPMGRYAELYYGDVQNEDGAQQVPVTGNEVEGIDVIMPPSTGISGSLSTSVNLQYASYDVSAYAPDPDSESGFTDFPVDTAYVNALESAYSLTSLSPGRYRVCATLRGSLYDYYYSYHTITECFDDILTGIEAASDVVVSENSVTPNIDFVFGESKQYGTISGMVTDPDGNPLSGLRVVAYPYPNFSDSSTTYDENVTDIDGRYTLTSVLPMSVTLLFDNDDERYELFNDNDSPWAYEYYGEAYTLEDATYISIEPGSTLTEVNAQLNRKGEVTGRILIQGEPLTSQPWITLRRRTINQYFPEDQPYYAHYESFNDVYNVATGDYTLDNIQPGTYLLEVTVNERFYNYYGGENEVHAKAFNVDVDQTTTDIDVNVAEGKYEGAIEGTVTVDGVPAAGVQVQLIGSYLYGYYPPVPFYEPTSDLSNVISYALTDENGNYTIGGLTTGQHVIRFVPPDPDYATVTYYNASDGTFDIALVDGETISGIDANLEKAGSISGTILRSDGEPASHYEFVVERQIATGFAPVRQYLYTDFAGNYSVDRLPPGTYQLRFLLPYSYVTHLRLEVVVGAGQSLVEQNGIAGAAVPTSLTVIDEPTIDKPTKTDLLFVPYVTQ